MKKLLAFAAVAAIAATTQATNIKWGLNEGESLSTLGFSDGTIYLIQGAIPEATALAGKTSFTTSDLGGTIVANDSLTSGFYADDSGINVDNIGGSTGRKPFYLAVFNTDGSAVAIVGETTTVNVKSGTLSTPVKYDAADFTKYSAQAVPEPTTVALLALGLAAVGLKRKVA